MPDAADHAASAAAEPTAARRCRCRRALQAVRALISLVSSHANTVVTNPCSSALQSVDIYAFNKV